MGTTEKQGQQGGQPGHDRDKDRQGQQQQEPGRNPQPGGARAIAVVRGVRASGGR